MTNKFELDLEELNKVTGGANSANYNAYVKFIKKVEKLANEWSDNNPDASDEECYLKVHQIADELLNNYDEHNKVLIMKFKEDLGEYFEYVLKDIAYKL